MMQCAENAIQDLRFALRGWGKAPGFAVAAIATLAIGIGANTAIFSVVSGVLLRPLPFAHPEGLVQLYEMDPRDRFHGDAGGPVTYRDLEEWRTQSRLFEGMVTYRNFSTNLQGFGEPEQVATVQAERGLFGLLGVAPLVGRTFDGADPLNVVVASYAFWRGHFDGDKSAIGRSITMDGQPFTLVGVMPDGFQFPYSSTAVELWVPWDAPAALRNRPNGRLDAVVARLKQGVATEAARQELSAMEGPSQAGREARIRLLKDVVSGAARESLLVLLGAVGMVLLVACVNVANLLLARTASRGREIAIRAALGAGRLRLMRQFLTESLLLALAGGVAGLVIGMWGSRVLVRIASAQIPRAGEIGLDWRVFAFLLAVCMATGIGFGLAPAIAAARGGASALKSGSVRSALRDVLVVVEIALAFVLLAGAGLLMRTFLNLQRTDTGLNAVNVLTVHLVVSGAPESAAIEERVAQIPGVLAAGLISLLPLQNSGWSGGFTIVGRPETHETELRYVTPGYFRAMGIPLRRGREFSPRDGPEVPRVILVNETLARRYFPNEDPVGRSTDRGTIIGVVGDVRQDTLGIPAKPEIYYTVAQNFAQIRRHGSTLVVRGSGRPEALAGAIRAAIREVSPGQALFRVATMRQVIQESLANPRLYTWLLGLFAAMGMLLAAAGIYGVIAYLVALRTREFGIRMALGAGAGRVLRLVMKRGALLVALGLAFGIGAAAALTRVLSGVLYGVAATDPVTFAAMAVVLAVVAMAACLAPARRAARVDPSVALRTE
ncbi:MAG TPA: ABC transporter permease [Candidatus Acidoferrales bacterium]|jgi:predicted permease|nr:ABC transporter permease [Candidatus Acidoferrales bacterium]